LEGITVTKEGFLSETDTCREILLPFIKDCKWILDVGFGGSALCDRALTFDMPQAYTRMGDDKQILQGSCRDLSMFCDQSLCAIFASHLIEDFQYTDQINIITEWRRVLKSGGLLLINCPDQQRFLAHCSRTAQPINTAHYEQDFSLQNFKDRVLRFTGDWKEAFCKPNHGPYSWLLVVRKI
jgi:hypothetical protein